MTRNKWSCKKHFRIIILILLLCFLLNLCPLSVSAATKSVTFTNINQYEQLKALTAFTIRWTASGGTVSNYTFSLRYLYDRDELKNIVIYSGVSVSAADACFRIPGDVLSPRGLYRYSVCAKMDGKNVWSEERYFYVSTYPKLTSTFNFHIYNGFGETTKNAAYYVTQTWANALGQSYAATYPLSQGTDDVGTTPDGETVGANGRNVISVGWYGANAKRNGVTVSYVDLLGRRNEIDVYLNRDKPFVNSAQVGKIDAQSVLAHEMGHVYGMCDKYEKDGYGSWATEWTMFTGGDPTNSIKRRSLEAYDIRHLRWLYDSL